MYFRNFYEWSCFCKVEFYEVLDLVKNEKVETMSSVKHIYHQINWLLNLKQVNWGWWEKLVIKFSSVEKNVDEEIWDSKTIISREMLIMSLNKSMIAGQDKIRNMRRRNWLWEMEGHDVSWRVVSAYQVYQRIIVSKPSIHTIRCITDSRERERVSACLVLIEQLIIDLSTGGPPYLSPIYSIDCNLSPAKYHHISPFLMQPVDVKWCHNPRFRESIV